MSCCKQMTAMLVAALVTTAIAADDGIDALIERTRELVQAPEALVDQEFAETLRAPRADGESLDWVQRGTAVAPMEPVGPDTAQGRGWSELEGQVFAGEDSATEGPPRPPVPEDVLYVYISLSMPAATIRSLFLEALDLEDSINTVFVLRGWDVPGPNRLVARLNALFPDAEHLGELPNVQINPVLYQQQHIELVPTYSKQDAGGRWGQVVGITTLEDAVRRIEAERYDGEIIGPAFQIEEPDIIKLIEARAAGIDWNAEVERVRDGMLTRTTTGRELPYAVEDTSYLVDLTIVNNQDLAGTTGEVFAFAGDTINPLDYLTLSRKYVFIDANNPEQVGQALKWREQHSPLTIITTLPVATVEDRKRVIGTLGQPVYEINDLLVRRFQLRAVPAIAYQDGRMLRIDVVATGPVKLTTEMASERR